MVKAADKNIYQNNWQHLTDELTKLDLLLQMAVLKFRESLSEKSQDTFKGFFLSDQEIDNILINLQQQDKYSDFDVVVLEVEE